MVDLLFSKARGLRLLLKSRLILRFSNMGSIRGFTLFDFKQHRARDFTDPDLGIFFGYGRLGKKTRLEWYYFHSDSFIRRGVHVFIQNFSLECVVA